jgi:hypothetical protein
MANNYQGVTSGLAELKFVEFLADPSLVREAGKLAAEVPSWFEHLEFLGLPAGAVGLFSRMTMPRRVKVAIGGAPD